MWFCIFSICALVAVLLVLSYLLSPTDFQLDGSHVMITGGSSGIGKALAIAAARKGASITIIARNKKLLEEAEAEIKKHVKDPQTQKVVAVSVDVTSDYSIIEAAVHKASEDVGPVDMLVNSAGFSVAGKFEEIPLEAFQKMLSINYLGSVAMTRAVVKQMKVRGQGGRIVLVSSQAGQTGIYGFGAYSPSKFALRGLAEVLQMELKPYGIYVTLSHPPDTDTPGFKEEMKTKPEESCLISETSGLMKADVVAKGLLSDAVRGRFLSYIGFEGWMLACLTAGFSPVTSIKDYLQQVVFTGIFRAVSVFYLLWFDRIVKTCKQNREQKETKKAL